MPDDLAILAGHGGPPAKSSASLDAGAQTVACANCGAPVSGAYCSICGQERNTHRRSISKLLQEVIREITSFDSRILRTAWALVFRPGELTLAFHEGRPRRYVPALRLYLFVSLIFFVVLGTAGIAVVQLELFSQLGRVVTEADGRSYAILPYGNERVPIPDWEAKFGPHYLVESKIHFFAPVGAYRNDLPAAARNQLEQERMHSEKSVGENAFGAWLRPRLFKSVDALESDPAAINEPLTKWIPRILFLLLPLYAVVLALFYWRQRKCVYFVDHLVFSLNAHSFAFVAILLAVGIARIVPGEAVGWLTLTAVGLYILLAMRRFYRQGWVWTVAKFAGVSLVYGVFMLGPAVLAVLTASILRI